LLLSGGIGRIPRESLRLQACGFLVHSPGLGGAVRSGLFCLARALPLLLELRFRPGAGFFGFLGHR
jgi:hypothetical protein